MELTSWNSIKKLRSK